MKALITSFIVLPLVVSLVMLVSCAKQGKRELASSRKVASGGQESIITGIALGRSTSCAIIDNSKVKCWGGGGYKNDKGKIVFPAVSDLPFVNLGSDITSVRQLALGKNHLCAIVNDGKVKCWGGAGDSTGIGKLIKGYGKLGYGDKKSRWSLFEMGDVLPYVDLGTNRTAKYIATGVHHTCAILDNDKLKCWGWGSKGRLGYGDTKTRGDGKGEMGDNLPYVDLGNGRTAKQVGLSEHHSCALLDNDQVKCWGKPKSGSLGYGDKKTRGDEPGEMGDNLPYINFGKGRSVKQLAVGLQGHQCVILDNNKAKCWGGRGIGRLGYGDKKDRGGKPGEMGDNLPYVDLGKNGGIEVTAKQLALGWGHTCAILDTEQAKCWGYGGKGQLGYGNKKHIGRKPKKMGIYLPAVPLGIGRRVKQIAAGFTHTCALLDTDRVKCWGDNYNGQLGTGNLDSIGNKGIDKMGDNLPYVNILYTSAEEEEELGTKAKAIKTGIDAQLKVLPKSTKKALKRVYKENKDILKKSCPANTFGNCQLVDTKHGKHTVGRCLNNPYENCTFECKDGVFVQIFDGCGP